jgi:hypothetical protein
VWVGYPNRLRPMTTEYHGRLVAGGTFPAEIWRAFTQAALAGTAPESFPSYSSGYAAAKRVVWRDGRLELDNGLCRGTALVEYFSGFGPHRLANCKPNEVDIPNVVGQPLRRARDRLALQPLKATVVYKPARPRQRVDIVVDQFPRKGHASSYDRVTLVLVKPLHGVVPRVVGLPLARARLRLRGVALDAVAPARASPQATVVRQWPRPGVAAAPHLRVFLTLATALRASG